MLLRGSVELGGGEAGRRERSGEGATASASGGQSRVGVVGGEGGLGSLVAGVVDGMWREGKTELPRKPEGGRVSARRIDGGVTQVLE